MGHPTHHHKINYIEFSTTDVARTKTFYSTVFGWEFQIRGPDYLSFSSETGGIDGGCRKGPSPENSGESAPLVVIYSADLKATEEEAIARAGGSIVVPTSIAQVEAIPAFRTGRKFAGGVVGVAGDLSSQFLVHN